MNTHHYFLGDTKLQFHNFSYNLQINYFQKSDFSMV